MLKANLLAHNPKFQTSNQIEKILIRVAEEFKNLMSNQNPQNPSGNQQSQNSLNNN